MPITDPFPLNIGTKQDSWAKLQLLANIDPAFKLIAEEFNVMVKALEFLYENMGEGGSGSASGFRVEKEKFTFGAQVQTIQLSGEFPESVEIHEELGYRSEDDFYTYNASTGEINFSILLPAGTVIHVLKFFYANAKQKIVATANQNQYTITGNPAEIDLHEELGYRSENEFYTYDATTGTLTIDNSITVEAGTIYHVTKYF